MLAELACLSAQCFGSRIHTDFNNSSVRLEKEAAAGNQEKRVDN